MIKTLRPFIISLVIVASGYASIVFAAPYYTQQRSLIPVDSTENVGTSTSPWAEGWFGNINLTSSTTLQNFTFNNATGTSATTTNFFSTTASSTNLFSSLLTVGGTGLVVDSSRNVGIGNTAPTATLHFGTSPTIDSTTSRLEQIGGTTVGTWSATALTLGATGAARSFVINSTDDTNTLNLGALNSTGQAVLRVFGRDTTTNTATPDNAGAIFLQNGQSTNGVFTHITGRNATTNTNVGSIAFVADDQATNAGSLAFMVRPASGSLTRVWNITSAGHLVTHADNTYDIGLSSSNRPANLYVGTNGTFGGTIAWGGGSAISSSNNVPKLDATINAFSGERIDLERNHNGSTRINIDNSTSGTGASVWYSANANGANARFESTSSAYTPSGEKAAAQTILTGNGANGVRIAATHASGPISLWSYNAEALSFGASQAATFSGSITFGNFNATSTVATSTISTGGLAVGTSQLVVQQTSGNVGIGTTTPASLLHVSAGASATTTVDFGAQSASAKTCFNVRNNTGAETSFYFVGISMVVEASRCK